VNGAAQRIAERFTQATAHAHRQPFAQSGREATHQATLRHAPLEQRIDQSIDALRGLLHDGLSYRITTPCMIHHHRREGGERRRVGRVHPGDDLCGRVREISEQFVRHRRVGDTSIACPQATSNRLQAEICTAALVGDRKSVATDHDGFAIDATEADASGTDDHNAAICAVVCADAGDGCIAGEGDRLERERM